MPERKKGAARTGAGPVFLDRVGKAQTVKWQEEDLPAHIYYERGLISFLRCHKKMEPPYEREDEEVQESSQPLPTRETKETREKRKGWVDGGWLDEKEQRKS